MSLVFITSTSDTDRITFEPEYKYQNNKSIGFTLDCLCYTVSGKFLYCLSNIKFQRLGGLLSEKVNVLFTKLCQMQRRNI